MTKPPTQHLAPAGINDGGIMGEGEPVYVPLPGISELDLVRNRMRARVSGMSYATLKRMDACTLVIDGEVTIAQLEALLFLMTDSLGPI